MDLVQATECFASSRLLGSGAFGAVYEARFPDGTQAAVKVMDLNACATAQGEFLAQVTALYGIQHPNILPLLSICTAPGNKMLLVVDLMEGGTLADRLRITDTSRALTWMQRLVIAIGIARGLACLHGQDPPVLHRDLKPKNVLLCKNLLPKIADFGVAKRLDGDVGHETRVVGSYGYCAPEYMSTSVASCESDVYSYGILLMELMTGHPPFDEHQPCGMQHLLIWVTRMLEANETYKLADPLMAGVHFPAFHMVVALAARCASSQPWTRPTMPEVAQILQACLSSLM
eukprot:jgi/Chlat1/1394/Chrsp12S02055